MIYGGSALLLTLNRQINTGDVDAVFEGNKDFIKRLAAEMAEEFGWDENWLNDGVKGWLSNRDADPDVKALFKTYPSEDQPGLRVYTAKPEYLFAMKCRAMRIGGIETNSDIDDIKLSRSCNRAQKQPGCLDAGREILSAKHASTQNAARS